MELEEAIERLKNINKLPKAYIGVSGKAIRWNIC